MHVISALDAETADIFLGQRERKGCLLADVAVGSYGIGIVELCNKLFLDS